MLMHRVKFNQFPSQEVIIGQLQKTTGLSVKLKSYSQLLFAIEYNQKALTSIYLNDKTDMAEVTVMSYIRHYIFYSTIHSLEELGGELQKVSYLPKWKGKKYSELNWWECILGIQ